MSSDLHWTIYKEMAGQVTCMHGLDLAIDKRSGDYTYRLYDDSGGWVCERVPMSFGPIFSAQFSGRVATLDEAREWADRDWEQVQRLREWVGYMLTTPPPGS